MVRVSLNVLTKDTPISHSTVKKRRMGLKGGTVGATRGKAQYTPEFGSNQKANEARE